MRMQKAGSDLPQSLCWQYYRGNSPATEAVWNFSNRQVAQEIPVVVQPVDYPAFTFYFRLYGRKNPILPANRMGAVEREMVRKAGTVIVCTLNDSGKKDNGATFNTLSRHFWFGHSDEYLAGDNF